MLFTPLVRPLDLLGNSELNRATNERHFISSQSERIFVPQLGPFYRDTMTIRDVATGNVLELEKDYRLIHMVSAATEASSKEVDAVVYITNETISEVLITYQAIGGIYAEGSIALLEILDRFKGAQLPPVYWSQIIGLPDTFPVTPHKHTIYDIEALEQLVSALTSVYDALVGKDIPKFKELYQNLDTQLTALEQHLNGELQLVDNTILRIESNVLYRGGDILITDNNQSPADRFGYGSWQRLPETFLYGQTQDGMGSVITNIANVPGHVARITNMWEQVDEVKETSYVITANRSAINEGQSVTFTLRSTGLTEGTKVPYQITGVSATDIVESLTGNFVVNEAGLATITVTTREDRTSEGTEYIVVALVQYATIRTSVILNDTSRAPTYAISFTTDIDGNKVVNNVNEGTTFYIYIRTTEVDNGTVLNLFYNGSTTTNADFNATLPTQVVIEGNKAVVPITVKNDILTEGTEMLTVSLSRSSYDAALVTETLRINDTSRAAVYDITYTLSDTNIASITSVNEGVRFFAIIKTENVAENTVINVTTSGNIGASDFSTTPPSTVTIKNGMASFPIQMAADLTTEGNETLTLNLMVAGASVFNKSITISDSSSNPNTQMKFSSNSSGSNNITTANEGETVYLVVNTVGVPDGTIFKVIHEGSASATDFTTSFPTSVTVNSNRAVITYAIKADNLTDGNKELRVRLRHNVTNVELSSAAITINDTSKAATYTSYFASDAAGTKKITSANEGGVIYGIIKTTDVPDNTILYTTVTIGGKAATVANGDVTVNVAASVKIVNNLGTLNISLSNDALTEGNESLVMSVATKSGGTAITSSTLTVNDTSKTPTYAMRMVKGTISAKATATSGASTDVVVNMNYALIITTTNVADNTMLYLRRNASVVAGTNYLPDAAWSTTGSVTPPASVTIKNNQAIAHFKVSLNYKNTADKDLTFGLFASASGGTALATIKAKFLNPSVTAYYTSDAAGTKKITASNEGVVAYLVIEQKNIPAGSTVYGKGTIGGALYTNADILVADLAAEFTTTTAAGLTIKKFTIVADTLTEGDETLTHLITPVKNNTTFWSASATLKLVDSSRRATKIRAGVVSGQVNLTGTTQENFDPADQAVFITPEGAHEAWTVTIGGTGSTTLKTNIWNRSGTSRVGYSGNTNYAVIDIRKGTGTFATWQKAYHNEIATAKGNADVSLSGFTTAGMVVIASADGEHEALNIVRTSNKVSVNVFNRSGTNRINYSGKVNITAMKPYIPHYDQHNSAPYPRIVYAQLKEEGEAITSFEMFPYNLQDTTKYAIMYCPEAANEAWGITRATRKLTGSTFNRSGTSRVGYTGKINWAIIQLKADSNMDRTTRRTYVPGGNLSTFQFKKDRLYLINIHGGGGSGGNAIYYHSGATELFGSMGGNSSVSIQGSTTTTAVLQANGGNPGGRGCWNNGSAYRNGKSGTGGSTVAVPTTANFKDVNAVLVNAIRANGGAGSMSTNNVGAGGVSSNCPESTYFGAGGKGHYGSGSAQHGYGGSGGGGGGIVALVRFTADATGTVKVGKGGTPYDDSEEYYQKNWHYGYGESGKDGIVVIEDIGNHNTVITITANVHIESTIFGFTVTESSYQGFNLYDAFYAANKRAPTNTDTILVYVPAGVAAIGTTKSLAGIMIDSRCNNAKSIHILNYGYIYGCGGSGGLFDSLNDYKLVAGSRVEAGPAIQNDSTVKVTVDNYGVIAGGGGYGSFGGISYVRGGGGGAPYGIASNYGRLDTVGIYPAFPASLHIGGNGSPNANGNGYGGKGGDPGYDGEAGTYSANYDATRAKVGLAGLRTVGNVTITNRSGGVVRGRTS